jgi:hypothetical protein
VAYISSSHRTLARRKGVALTPPDLSGFKKPADFNYMRGRGPPRTWASYVAKLELFLTASICNCNVNQANRAGSQFDALPNPNHVTWVVAERLRALRSVICCDLSDYSETGSGAGQPTT